MLQAEQRIWWVDSKMNTERIPWILTLWGQMVGWHVSLIWKWQRFTITGGHQGEEKKRWLFSSSSWPSCLRHWMPPSVCLEDRLFQSSGRNCWQVWSQRASCLGDSARQRHSSHCAQEANLACHTNAPFALLSLLGTSSTPSPTGNSTCPLVPSCWTRVGSSVFSRSLPFGLQHHLCGLLFCGVTGTVLCPEQRGLNNQPLYL